MTWAKENGPLDKKFRPKKKSLYRKGHPWFRVTYLFIADPSISNGRGYIERFLVVSNNTNRIVRGFINPMLAYRKADFLNKWWEKDYRSIRVGNWDAWHSSDS